MQQKRTIRINLPGRHCSCGALRTGRNKRCEKCQARAGWYRHNCRRPQRTGNRAHPRRHAETKQDGTPGAPTKDR